MSVEAVILAEKIEARIGLNYEIAYLRDVMKLLKLELFIQNWEDHKALNASLNRTEPNSESD